MYPHERSLVKRLADKPFALIGVNSDSDLVKLKKRMEEESITWRRWNVNGWPTIYVIDAQGVIRFRDVRDKQMDAAVDSLLKEMGQL